MRTRLITTTLAFALTLLGASVALAQKDTLRVLAIGNSFSEDAVEQNLYELGRDGGTVFIIGNMYIGGCSLERHYNNMKNDEPAYRYRKVDASGEMTTRPNTTLEYALADDKWDCVSLQQASHYSGMKDTYEPYLGALIAFLKEKTAPGTRLMWHQTWAYATNAVHASFPNYDKDQAKMYQAIMDASHEVCDKYGLEVIPCGTAVQNARSSYIRDNITRDGFHLNYTVGRYLAACTWYEALTHKSVVGNGYSAPYLIPDYKAAAQACAHAAVESPYAKVTTLVAAEANYDEDKIPPYTLPDALVSESGKKIKTATQWENIRRPELLSLFETEMFGKAPVGKPEGFHWKVMSEDCSAYGGKATRKEVRIFFTDKEKQYIDLLMYTPNNAGGPVPVFLNMNFNGNNSVVLDDVYIPPYEAYSRFGRYQIYETGESVRRVPMDLILDRGYGFATFNRADVDPDWYDGFVNGVHSLFYKEGQRHPEADEWGTIAAWAWGMSRALDYLEEDASVDPSRVISIGHSRLGKTALWAGAMDQRFAMVVSNCSGCGGAALSRRAVGETVSAINKHFPHWFCDNYKKYNDNEDAMPFDQHELLALIAPRPLAVASATEDLWADPEGERLATEEAKKVYALYGAEDKVQYHTREGGHDILAFDWEHYIDLADQTLTRPQPISCSGVEEGAANVWIDFARGFSLGKVPASVPARIAVDSKYWMWVNGKLAVFEGGLKRGPNPHDSYYDEIDIAPYLKKGDNEIKVLQWYFGKEGFSHKSSGSPVFIFDAPSIGLFSDAQWDCRVNTAYGDTGEPFPNYRLPESNIHYDASAVPAQWQKAVCVKNSLGNLHKRPIPQWKDYGVKKVKYVTRPGEAADTLVARLPYNMQMTPVLKIRDRRGGSLIGIETDHSHAAGTDNIRAEYVTRKGVQKYESIGWMNGDYIFLIVPKGVKVCSIKYRETGYDTAPDGHFSCDDEFYNSFWKKGLRTLYVNMRDTFFDCPERERAQWWGDAVVLMGECFYTYSTSTHALMSKAIHELAAWQNEDGSLHSPVPAGNYNTELPAQMLASIGRYGFWNYYMNTGDKQTVQDVYPAVKKYLGVWEQDADGLTAYRTAGWNWGDWGDERDMRLIYAGWHCIALETAADMADLLGYKDDASAYRQTMEEVKAAYNACWTGSEYRHPSYEGLTDDRVQALAVLAGIAAEDKYPAILEVLKKEEHASPYMEKYVMEALFEMGYGDYAMERTRKRFSEMVLDSEHNTLYEGWGIGENGFGGGTVNHAWSGGSITVIASELCGIRPVKAAYEEFDVKPVMGIFKTFSIDFPTLKGTVGFSCKPAGEGYEWTVTVPEGAKANVFVPGEAEAREFESGVHTFAF